MMINLPPIRPVFRAPALVANFHQVALAVLLLNPLTLFAGEKTLIQLRDFTQTEVKCGGFSVPTTTRIHIQALGGGGEKSLAFSTSQMYAYGWIINADTREPVWVMTRDNTVRQKDDRSFDGAAHDSEVLASDPTTNRVVEERMSIGCATPAMFR